MSLDEFCKYDFDEFESICKAWQDMQEVQNRDQWERTRLLAAICIQPHIKKRITPHQLIPLPWDRQGASTNQENISAEERRRRFEKLAKV